MELNHQNSARAHKSELVSLFKTPSTQTDIESGYYEVIKPTQSLDDAMVVEFTAPDGPFFTDLANSFIKIQFSVSTTAGAAIVTNELSFINLIAHTLWSKIDLYISGESVTSDNRYYPYSSMIMTLLGKNESWSSASSELEGFYKDKAQSMDDYAGNNTGFVSRRLLMVANAVGTDPPIIETCMRPYIGAFQHHRLIPDRTEIRLELHRAKDSFALIHNDVVGASIKLHSVLLNLRRVKLSDNAFTQINDTLIREHALFPITRLRVFSESFKSQAIDLNGILKGSIPTHVHIGFVSTAALQGSNKLNPFNFQNLGLNRLQVTAAGTNYPRRELTPKFSGQTIVGSQVAREYHRLLAITHKANSQEGLLFSMSDFCGGYALYSFDLSPDLDAGHWSPSFRGSLDVHGSLANQPTDNISIIVFAETPGVWELDGSRNVSKDW